MLGRAIPNRRPLSPHIATATGFIFLIVLVVLSMIADWRVGRSEESVWRYVLHLSPVYYGDELKRPELARVVTGAMYLLVFAFGYLFAGYAVFRRRDA